MGAYNTIRLKVQTLRLSLRGDLVMPIQQFYLHAHILAQRTVHLKIATSCSIPITAFAVYVLVH